MMYKIDNAVITKFGNGYVIDIAVVLDEKLKPLSFA